MLKLAILLHTRGFFITFVNTEYNHRRLLRSRGPDFLTALPDFKFAQIPDGLPSSGDEDVTQDVLALCQSTGVKCLDPFLELLRKINGSVEFPPVSCVIPDAIMSFAVVAAKEIDVPCVCFRTTSAATFLANKYLPLLMEKGLIPLKDSTYLSNGHLDTPLDFIPALRNCRLKDLPNYTRTTDKNDFMLNKLIKEAQRASTASALVFNTFDDLEHDVLNTLSEICPPIYPIGPLQFLTNHLPETLLELIRGNLWKEDSECLQWLDHKPNKSVVYVNFGSIAVLSNEQVMELAWGLAKSEKNFLWIVRSDAVNRGAEILSSEFAKETEGRGLITKWCPQEQVLKHPSMAAFLTHCGWNSMIESLGSGVPMICWPFFADQHLNCRLACTEWGVGMEIENDVKRDQVEKLVREMIEGEKGKEMQKAAQEWKRKAEAATGIHGSSFLNFDKLIKEVLQSRN